MTVTKATMKERKATVEMRIELSAWQGEKYARVGGNRCFKDQGTLWHHR